MINILFDSANLIQWEQEHWSFSDLFTALRIKTNERFSLSITNNGLDSMMLWGDSELYEALHPWPFDSTAMNDAFYYGTRIYIELFGYLPKFWQKRMVWLSLGGITTEGKPGDTLSTVLSAASVDRYVIEAIEYLCEIMEKERISKKYWINTSFDMKTALREAVDKSGARDLGLNKDATRSDVYLATGGGDNPIWQCYCQLYTVALARQHGCDGFTGKNPGEIIVLGDDGAPRETISLDRPV